MNLSKEIYELAEHLDLKKAEDIVLIDVAEITVLADAFIILNGISTPHVKKLAEETEEFLAKKGMFKLREEGYTDGKWIVLDYGDFIVHIFNREEREYYGIERLWKNENNFTHYNKE